MANADQRERSAGRLRVVVRDAAVEVARAAIDAVLDVLEGKAPYIAIMPAELGCHVDEIEVRRARIMALRARIEAQPSPRATGCADAYEDMAARLKDEVID